jgi:hypothetical protein
VIGAAYVLLALSTLLQGAAQVLAPFGVPEQVMAAPHFLDFFHFLFVHMAVLGVLIILLGQLVTTARKQRLVARVLLLVEVHYLYLDLRTSTWGSGLYAHDKSLVPVFIDLVVALCLLYLSVRSSSGPQIGTGPSSPAPQSAS